MADFGTKFDQNWPNLGWFGPNWVNLGNKFGAGLAKNGQIWNQFWPDLGQN